MFAFIRGILHEVARDHIVLENNGIGYQIYVPFNGEFVMPSENEEILVYTYFNATENGVTLYGFFTREDREMFTKMTTVSGIGPKGAISILSTLSSKEIIMAILNDDDKMISKAPGIGPKTARRMILDLKDKLDVSEDMLLTDIGGEEISLRVADSDNINDAIMALNALGYSYNEASKAVRGIENAKDYTVDELLSLALKEL